MRSTTALVFCFALAGTSPLQAQAAKDGVKHHAAEIALSNGALQARYITDGERVGVENGRLDLGMLITEERDTVLTGAVLVPADIALGHRLNFIFGPQVYAALLETENQDVFAAAFGVEARYTLARDRDWAVVGSAYYSPDILTFGAADNVTDLAARMEMRLTESLVGFAGYRWFELDLLASQERELQEEFFAGLRWNLK